MRVTIIPADGFVSVDGEAYSGIDLSFMRSDIHAIQWYETEGDVEVIGSFGKLSANEKIRTLDGYEPVLAAWGRAKEAAAAAFAEAEIKAEQQRARDEEIKNLTTFDDLESAEPNPSETSDAENSGT